MKKYSPTHSWRNPSIPGPAPTPRPAAETARRFLDALGRLDFVGLREHLHADVSLRVMLPRHLVARTSAPEAVTAFRSWLEPAHEFEIAALDHQVVEGHEHVASRFLLRPDWAPDQWHLIEQVGFVHVRNHRISRIDLVCSGFRPVHFASGYGVSAPTMEGLR
jgi:ketosteroid isomerase-like protein